jgi:2-dehydro-3-deoxy-D-gluconate 5-dehydrogenase
MSFDLSGKTALVTGCRRGIGRAAALALAGAGADIVGVSLSLTEEDAVANEVRSLGREFRPYRCDFSDR